MIIRCLYCSDPDGPFVELGQVQLGEAAESFYGCEPCVEQRLMIAEGVSHAAEQR